MKRHLAPALFSLTLCAVMGGVRTAGAQTANDVVTVEADSAVSTADLHGQAAATFRIGSGMTAGRPTILAPTPMVIGRADDRLDARAPLAVAPMVDWKMPTSRALMIGGVATAIIGLAVVGEDTGAIIALTGTAVAVYGLYLHYNR